MALIKNKSGSVRGLHTRRRFMVTAVSACFTASSYALPTAPTVVNGSASFSQAGNVLNVTNSNGAIINWNTFSIGSGETTRFIQTSSSSSVLNRVLANDPSIILGTLTSNGKVFLINPNGIMVGAGARIDVAGFVAGIGMTNADFLAGKLKFDTPAGATGSIINHGTITTPSGGSVYLVATNVTNDGIITTPQGDTILAAGQTVTLLDTSTPGVGVEIVGSQGNATNLGTIVASAGKIGIAGAIVKNSGTLSASSAVSQGGKIFLKASQDAYVDGNGRIVTTGTKGGTVEVLGNRVAVMGNAVIDASGTQGGGTVLIGGDYQGKNPAIQNSQITYFGADASIKANATDKGNGGKVIVWADDTTRAYGKIEAKGGPNGGNGGFVEVSGKAYLDFDGLVNTLAPKGKAGTLLLDPNDVTIVSGSGYGGSTFNPYSGGYGGYFDTASSYGSTIYWATVDAQLFLGNVAITTSGNGGSAYAGNITISSGSFNSSNSHTLSLFAHNNISANGATVNMVYGGLEMYAGWNGTFANGAPSQVVTPGTGDILLQDSHLNANNGSVKLVAGRDISLYGSYGSSSISANVATLNAGRDISLYGSYGSSVSANVSATINAGRNINITNSYIESDGPVVVSAGNNLVMSNGSIGGYSYSADVTVSAKNISMNNNSSIEGYRGVSVTASGLLDMYGGSIGGDYSYNVSVSAGSLQMAGNANIGGSYGQTLISAGSISMNSSYIHGEYGVSIVTNGPVSLTNNSYIFGYYGGVSVVAGGDITLDRSGIYANYGGVAIGASNLNLGYSYIQSNDSVQNIDVIVTGDIKLTDSSAIQSGNDVNLKLTGATSQVVLSTGNGYGGSSIWSDRNLSQAMTTHIEFLGRTSGGVVIDGVETTTTSSGYGGSGFFGGSSRSPSSIGNGLEIVYGSPNNPAGKLIDEFFDNLKNDKKKNGDNTSTDKGTENEKQSDVGQCV